MTNLIVRLLTDETLFWVYLDVAYSAALSGGLTDDCPDRCCATGKCIFNAEAHPVLSIKVPF